MIRPLLTVICVLTFAAAVSAQEKPSPKKPNPRPAEKAAGEPFDKASVKEMSAKCVTLQTKEGDIEIELYPESAPESVRNFLNLAGIGALDTTTFSRVVPGFVIQGGDLYSRETPVTHAIGTRARKTIPDEPNKILHERGVVSMARSDEPNSATTNFFILVDKAAYLDGKFAAFGRVVKGMEVVDAINKAPSFNEKPAAPVRITKAIIAACPEASATAN